MYYKPCKRNILHYVYEENRLKEDDKILKVFGTKEKALEYIKKQKYIEQ